MENAQPKWQWKAGVVDEQEEHIELRYGNAENSSYENWTPIARIAKPNDHVFKVEWLVKQDSPGYEGMVDDARHSLNFYLVEKDELDPWAYAIYHCNTSANMYSHVHWSYFSTGRQGKQHTSRVIELSTKESTKLFGDSGKPGQYIKKEGI